MPYHDRIIRNLPLYSPPGVYVTLKCVGRAKVQFRIESASQSFLLVSNGPDIFALGGNQRILRGLFADACQRCADR